jgi:hypothetical protein
MAHSPRRLTCLHESYHIVAARTQGIATRLVEIASPGTVLESATPGRTAQGRTVYGISHAQLPKLGERAAIALMAGPLGERFCSGPDWIDGGQSDFKLVVAALKYTNLTYADLVVKTEAIVREWYGLASRLADWLEVYGSLDSTKIYRLCNSLAERLV